jgi:hypothetical protein
MKRYICAAGLLFGIVGCTPVQPISTSTSEHGVPKRKGIVLVDGSRRSYDPTPTPSKYYGQLYVGAKIYPYYDTAEGQSTLARYVATTFGNKVVQFGISVTPILGGTKFPAVVLFSYRFDSETQAWKISAREKYVSPTMLIDAGTKIEFEINYLYSTNTSVTLTKSATDVVSGFAILNPGAWILSSLSTPQVKEAVGKVDGSLSKLMALSTDYSVASYFQPAGDGSREATYDIIPVDSTNPLANVTLSTVLSPSLIGKPVVDPRNTPPSADSAVNPLISIKKDGSLQASLWQVLKGDASYVYLKNSASQKGDLSEAQLTEFEESCSNVRTKLQEDYGLNYYDSINSMAYILRATQYTKNPVLFESNCLSANDKQVLSEMGIPLLGPAGIAVGVAKP